MGSIEKSFDGQVERVLAFLNSRGVGFETGTDHLLSAEAASSFLRPTFGGATEVAPRVLAELKRLRQALLDLITSTWQDRSAARVLNEISQRSTYTIAFESDGQTQLQLVTPGSPVSLILRDVATLIEAGQWSRLKNCSNEACASTFFDRSRNKTQRWHSFELCGNKHNVAAHRARHSGAEQT